MADFSAFRARLERAGLSQNASNWLTKALSPATPSGAGALIPDATTPPVATPEYVVSGTFGPIPAVGTTTWDCLIYKPPTYPLLAVIVTAPSGFDFSTSWSAPGVFVNSLSCEPSTVAVPQLVSIDGYSAVSYVSGLAKVYYPSTQPLAWRSTARSITEYLVASDLNNEGTVTSGQYSARIQPYRPMECLGTNINVLGNGSALTAWDILEIPLNEADMTVMNPKVRVAPAKQGVYQPLYNRGPTFSWAKGRDMQQVGIVNQTLGLPYTLVFAPQSNFVNPYATGSLQSYLAPMDTTRGIALDSWLPGIVPDINGFLAPGIPYTWGTDNTMTGVSIYRGLDLSAKITVKAVLGIELLPSPTSPIRQFTVPSACNEPGALQLYYDLVSEMPHTYPANSNFLNAVIAAANTLLPMLLPHVPAIIRGIRSIVAPTPARESQPEMRVSASSRPMAVRVRASSVSSRVSRVSKSSRVSKKGKKTKARPKKARK